MTIILEDYPPSTLQGVGPGCRKNPRIIVGENYCHFGAPYIRETGGIAAKLLRCGIVSEALRRNMPLGGVRVAQKEV